MNTDRSDSHPTGRDSRPTVAIKEAAATLGLSVDAVRSRIHRGTLEGVKVGNAWRVYLPDDVSRSSDESTGEVLGESPKRQNEPTAERLSPTVDQPVATVDDSRNELVEQLRSEVEYLREQHAGTLHQLASERERADVLQREALGRIEALSASVEAERTTVADQAAALKHAEERTREMEARIRALEVPQHDENTDQVSAARPKDATSPTSIWARLRRWIAGERDSG